MNTNKTQARMYMEILVPDNWEADNIELYVCQLNRGQIDEI